MKKIYTISILLIFFAGNKLFAQNMPINNFYLQNPVIFNPAAVGINRSLTAFFDYSDQWTGIKGAPETGNFGLSGLITKSMGLGFKFNKNKEGIFTQISPQLMYSYRISIAQKNSLAFGFSVGITKNRIDRDIVNVSDLNDPALQSNLFNESLLNSGFGIHYNWRDLEINAAIPLLYSTEEKKIAESIMSLIEYNIKLADNTWILTPAVYYRFDANNFHQADLILKADWNRKLWILTGYRTNNDILAAIGINLQNLTIGYAFEYNQTKLNVFSKGTHQILLMYKTPFSVSKKKPLYKHNSRSAWD